MKFAYADPPYLGLAVALYGDRHDEAAVYDTLEGHKALVDRLCDEFPDGWAMSLHSPALRTILPLCPEKVRVGSWVKPFCSYKKGVNPAYAWEPVIFWGGRRRTDGKEETVRDWVSANITLQRGFPGAKPESFCFWLFELLGARPEDEFHDLFPGSGAVSRAWDSWRKSRPLPLVAGPQLEQHELFGEPA